MKYTKYDDGSNVFFTSDTHFFHDNILNFCNRPFANIDEMNNYIIEKWNEKVPNDGIVYHLGDFGFGTTSRLVYLLRKLNGEIHLIIGNHDRKQLKDRVFETSFASVAQQQYIFVEGQAMYLNHCPLLCFDGVYRNKKTWQLFGHVHSGPNSQDGLDIPRLKILFPTQYDVGVDNNNFSPVSFYEIKNIINKQLLTKTN